jgi:hypothetical protein
MVRVKGANINLADAVSELKRILLFRKFGIESFHRVFERPSGNAKNTD